MSSSNFLRLVFSGILIVGLATPVAFAEEIDSQTVEVIEPEIFVLPPKYINPLKVKALFGKPGKVFVFKVEEPALWRGKVKNPILAKFILGGPVSSYEIYPSLTLKKKGKTTISLTDGKTTYLIKISVS